jgi:hypothetical protein
VINGHESPIIRGNRCRVLCDATVELLQRRVRPYVFEVTVTGLPPHVATRKYTIAAKSDNDAAMKGIQLFVEEFDRVAPLLKAINDAGK